MGTSHCDAFQSYEVSVLIDKVVSCLVANDTHGSIYDWLILLLKDTDDPRCEVSLINLSARSEPTLFAPAMVHR